MNGASLLVLGTNTFASEVADVASAAGWRVAGYVENVDRTRCARPLDGLPVHWIDDVAGLVDDHVAVCGLGTTFRTRFTEQAEQLGLPFATVVHPSAVVPETSSLGPGCVVGPGVVIGSHTSIGAHVVINRGTLVGHHDDIRDHVSIMPGANIAGVCSIGPATYVGMGAIIIDHITVGPHTVIGAGAVVVDDLPERVLAVGVPARIVKRGIDGK